MQKQMGSGVDLGPLRQLGENGRRLDDDGGAPEEAPRPVVDGAHVAAAVGLLWGDTYMTSALGMGGGGHQKEDKVREVA